MSVLKTASTRLEPPSFTRDTALAGLGFMGGFALRLTSDPALSLECEGRKFNVGDRVSLWSVDGHPEWAVRWVLNDDGTVSPLNNRDVCLGVNSGTNTPMLVACRRYSIEEARLLRVNSILESHDGIVLTCMHTHDLLFIAALGS